MSGIPVADDIGKEVTGLAVAAIFRGFKYMFCYKSLAKDLNSKIENLNNEKDRMKIEVDRERSNGKQIHADVLKWHVDVEEIQKKSDLSPSFKCIPCFPIPNPVSRLRLGREAVQKSKTVTELTDSATKLFVKGIAYLPQPSEDVLYTNSVFQDFPSRREAYGKLWKQLESEDCQILGIYGMPGAGKTLMTEQLRKDAQGQKKKIFDKVILAVVGSVAVDVIKLQDQLAIDLKCDLEWKDDIKNRAHQLKRSMMNCGKILVIFDDVWGEISICDIIGTSFNVPSSKTDPGRLDGDHSWKGCKILFTSREKLHCLKNNCKDPVEIKTLEDDEARDLFKNTLGSTDQVASPPDESLVQQVCRKCAGLPLIIHAVGKALKFKSARLWEDALAQLENCRIENVVGIGKEVYACLKLSFDNLEDDAKQCLLLCSLFPADESIANDMVVDLAAGSQLVHGGRTRVYAMIETLRSASLLLEGKDAESFRLHDIIRVVARSVAVKEHAFIIEKCGRGLFGNPADYGTGKVMQLELEKDDFSFPPNMACPHLHTLWLMGTYRKNQELQCKIKVPNFPGGMFSDLRFLVLENLLWLPQLFYLQPLNELKTIIVVECIITDETCFPESLETLRLWRCILLPTRLDFAKLKNLRKLDISGTNHLQMVPNTISSLSCLEVLRLRVPNSVDCTLMPKFNEISKLTCLTSLTISWSDFEPSQDTGIFGQLVDYNIRVGVLDRGIPIPPQGVETKRIELAGRLQFEGFQNLLEEAEIIILRNTDVSISRIWNSNREAFKDLKMLYVDVSDTMQYLARISIQSIPWQQQQQQSSFSNLTSLGISGCSAMKYLFNNFVAEYLVQLQELYILNCDRMEVIVKNEGKSDANLIIFSKLKVLHLRSLSNLKSFYGETKDMHSSSTSMMDNSVILSVQRQPLFDGMVGFPSLEVLKISSLNDTVSEIWGKKYYTNDNESPSFRKLKSLKVRSCSGLKNVFLHSSMAIDLIMHLEKMDISDCDTIEYLASASTLSSFSRLTSLNISRCCAMKYLFNNFVATSLVQLQELRISYCDRMEVIIINEGKSDGDLIQFPRLKSLELLFLSSLKTFYGGIYDMHSSSTSITDNSVGPSVQQPQPLFDGMVVFPSLEVLEISSLDDAVSEIWGKKYYTNDNTSSFRKLKSLKVHSCSGLKNVFLHASMAIDLIMHLEKMNISDCGLMREIIGKGEPEETTDDGIIVFPVLTKLKLVDLPNLSSLWCCRSGEANTYKVKFPVLVKLELVKLELKDLKIDLEAIDLGTDDSPYQLEYLNLSCDREIQLSSAWQLRQCDPESLTLGGCFSYMLKSFSCFKRLTELKVTELDCSTLFSLSVLESLQQLQDLKIFDCSLLEGIVEDARDDEASRMVKPTVTLFHLKLVILYNLPKLKSFIHSAAGCDLHMPALKRVNVVQCGVSTLFTCSFIQKLQQLEVLVVEMCNSLEGIVADERGSETSDTNDKVITLSKLSSVHLIDLPNLKSFSLAISYACSMPQLRDFELRKCPNLEYFTSLKTITGLVRVYSELHFGEEFPDLNNYIRQHRKIRDNPIHQPLQVAFFSNDSPTHQPLQVDFFPNDSPTHQPLQVDFFSYAWSCPWAC